MKEKKMSLKWGMMTAILVSWIAAVLIVIYIAGILINYNFGRNLEQTVQSSSESILNQIQIRFSDSMESSKAVSYDGVVRSAYRQFRSDGDNTTFYRKVTEYLSSNFSRDAKFRAVFISFWDPEITSRIYVINEKSNSYQILQQFLTEVRPLVMDTMAEADTDIRFLVWGGQLYMCRNLLDSGFRPYATVTMLCDASVLLQALQPLTAVGETMLLLDGTELLLDNSNQLTLRPEDMPVPEGSRVYAVDIDSHRFAFYVTPQPFNIWTDLPGLRTAAVAASAAVLPILAIMISVFYKTVTEPMESLVEGAHRLQEGKRGYQIEKEPNSREFLEVIRQFNTMSSELERQFARSQLEQQALQQAKIKALQSQINPHFLNNTLEVINWEARLSGADNVSEMIDALSTMLDAALDREGTGTVSLKRELEYADAYLQIIRRRLGSRFVVKHSTDDSLLECRVPKLVLQPIIENAVEHDITPRKGGTLEIRVSRKKRLLVMEVIHDGTMSAADRENIRVMLESADPGTIPVPKGGHVGLQNVATRLKMLYGIRSSITVEETEPGTVCAKITLPIDAPM